MGREVEVDPGEAEAQQQVAVGGTAVAESIISHRGTVPPHLRTLFGDDLDSYERFEDWRFGMRAHDLGRVGEPIREPADYDQGAVVYQGRLTSVAQMQRERRAAA